MTNIILEHHWIEYPVADLAALKAVDITLFYDGVIIDVLTMTPYGGKFVWVSTSTSTPDDINTVKPDSITLPDAGRWIREDFVGIKLTSDGKIDRSQLPDLTNTIPAVKDFYDPTPGLPVTPTLGDRYISLATANGWTIDYVYEWNSLIWVETEIHEIVFCFVESVHLLYIYDNFAWSVFGGTSVVYDDGANIKAVYDTRHFDFQKGGIKDQYATAAIYLADAKNTAPTTTNQTVLGSINELDTDVGAIQLNYLTTNTTQTITAGIIKHLNGNLYVNGDEGGKIVLVTDAPIELDVGVSLAMKYSGTPGHQTLLKFDLPTGDNKQIFPDKSGTFAMTTDIPATSNLTETTSAIMSITGGTGCVIGTGTTLEVKQSSAIQSGYLSSGDWSTFNGKEPAITTLPISKGGTNSGTALVNDKIMISNTGAIVESGSIPNGITATTQLTSDNSAKVATTAFVHSLIPTYSNPVTDVFTPTLGQTVFILSQTRSAEFHFILTVGGLMMRAGVHFTVLGTTLTWLDFGGITLKTTDDVVARYYY